MFQRFRRTRLNKTLRSLVSQTHVSVDDFIYPLFIRSGEGIKNEVASMPGVFQMSIDEAIKECEELKKLGLYAIILFGIPETKDSIGSDALCEHGIIASSIKEIKKAIKEIESFDFVIKPINFIRIEEN